MNTFQIERLEEVVAPGVVGFVRREWKDMLRGFRDGLAHFS
ncbi:hypothetical protein U8Y98_27305 [Priestia megaterium]